MEEKQPSLLHKISRVISDFFNPLLSLFIFFVYMSFLKYTLKESILSFLPILIIVIAPVIIWLIWNVKTGRYTNMDVSNRVQRKTLYIFIGICVVSYIAYHYFRNGQIDFVMLFILILLFALQISNYFIKSSMHTAFNIFVAALFFALNTTMGIIWLGIATLVGITRIILKRHTPKEVFMGAGIAFIVSFLYLYCHIQFQQ
ncbi:phosphatase PAP2 family protein [Chryseobacterium gambrini]|uniref:Phosphatase PAP2 family protein n=1 Tax=Chryseobacterium gambrini TaxID=373672 RepID=A0AAJ1R1Y9_9FLAO|nr:MULTISPECIES: phosphatase PAP2 family protein [Chryseobacterium]MDN4011762.1 phosphatase PAP2 family protein [Chryseobacterium gambrini]MDN4029281.1 phosphatase PAP2 family protein [Chryseobacterium gambrini]QWA39053.1 ABC transporter permease [Chryseobacterium sp. ZHDP1]